MGLVGRFDRPDRCFLDRCAAHCRDDTTRMTGWLLHDTVSRYVVLATMSEDVTPEKTMTEESADDSSINPASIIIAVVGSFVVLCMGLNVVLWWWAQRNAPGKQKKTLSAKKLKRQRLQMGVQQPGE